MELLQLVYFLELAESEHVTKTAEKLMISQPTLSLTIRRLEDELGAALFDRNGRNIRLNENGRLFRTYAEDALRLLQEGKSELSQREDKRNALVSVGIQSPYVWQDLTGGFVTRYPQYTLSQRSVEDGSWREALRSGEFDYYIGGITDDGDSAFSRSLASFTFAQGSLCVIVPRDSAFADRASVSLPELAGEAFISRPAGEVFQLYTDHLCLLAGFVPRISMVCDYTLREAMVAEGHGISFSSTFASRWITDARIRAVPVEGPLSQRSQQLVWLKTRNSSSGSDAFLAYVKEYAEKNGKK